MDNKAYEQYKATQPKTEVPQRYTEEPISRLSDAEWAVLIVVCLATGWALYKLFFAKDKKDE